MPAAIPAGIAAIKAASFATIATGVAVAGAAVQTVGMITGSKTLQKIGGIGSMIGGLGMGASMLAGPGAAAGAGAGAGAGAAGGAATGGSLFAKGANQLNAAQGAGGTFSSGGGLFSSGANQLNAAAGASQQGASAIPTMDRVKDVLTKYDTTANILGGIGQGYMAHQTEKMRQQVPRMQHQLEQDKFDQMQLNRDARTTIPNLRDMQSTGGGLLRR